MTAEWIAPILFSVAAAMLLALILTRGPCPSCGRDPDDDDDKE